jgi:predicted acylesterase/phospholipase RssA
MKIQLALQGGGARIVSLLGAAGAIQQLRDEARKSKQLNVTRVMGTSAGAIVGAMIAANVDIEKFRLELKESNRRPLLEELRNGWGANTRLTLMGRTYWRSDALKKLIKDTFAAKGVVTVADVLTKHGVDLRVVATDLELQGPIVYGSSNERRFEPIESALMNSCAIPFYFRSWKHIDSIVDGGVVQNFPCEELIALEKESGKAFGISFQDHKRSKPTGIREYGMSLLDTAMESATREAKLKLGRRICELPYKYDTFDFAGAFSDEGLGEHFDRCKELALNWFEKRIEYPHTYITEDFWSNQSPDTLAGLVKLYKVHEQRCRILYEELSMVVTAYGLSDPLLPDTTVTRLTFRTTNETMYFHRVSLSETNTISNLKSSNIRLSDGLRNIDVTILPMVDYSTRERKEVLIAFDEPLPPNTGPYSLVIIDSVLGLTELLASARKDEVTTNAERTDTPIGRCEVVIYLPEMYKDTYKVEPLALNPGDVVGNQFDPSWDPEKHQEGLFAVGWEGLNVVPGQDFGFNVELEVDSDVV